MDRAHNTRCASLIAAIGLISRKTRSQLDVTAQSHALIQNLGHCRTPPEDLYHAMSGWMLSKTQEFDPERLATAVRATFKRRGTEMPQSVPDALTREFFRDPSKLQQWTAFVRDLSSEPPSFETVVSELAAFLGPLARKA